MSDLTSLVDKHLKTHLRPIVARGRAGYREQDLRDAAAKATAELAKLGHVVDLSGSTILAAVAALEMDIPKAYLETWLVDPKDPTRLVDQARGLGCMGSFNFSDTGAPVADRARLAARAPEMARALLAIVQGGMITKEEILAILVSAGALDR